MNPKVKVCMISCMHGLYDDRIYWKEALSLKKHGYDVYHIGIGNKDKEFISDHGIKLIQVGKQKYFENPYTDKLYRIFTFKKNIYKKILEIAAELKADVYHFHDLQINKIGKQLKSLTHKPKVIYDVHEDYHDMFIHNIKRTNIFKIIIRLYAFYINRWELIRSKNCDFIITVLSYISNKFIPVHGANKVEILYNYTNLNPDIKKILETKKIYDALYCGLINESRGIYKIIESVKILKSKKSDIKILVMGVIPSAKIRREIQNKIEKYGLHNNLLIKDSLPYNQMDEFFQKSKVGLGIFMPIKVFYNSIQVKTFEYMAYGLPVVCSNFGYINKFVSESNSGIPVNPESPEEISNAILKLVSDKNLYKKYSQNGYNAVKVKYNWKTEEDKLINIYSKLLS